MAILSLAGSREDLRARLAASWSAATAQASPSRAADLGAVGPMMALLAEALLPNLVQTTEGTPALVHCGPFANIAHGTSSVVSQRMGLRLADYVVNETGFASDLGFEKYMDLVMPSSGIQPPLAVLVTTVQSVRKQGEGDLDARLRQPGQAHRASFEASASRRCRHQPLSQRCRRRPRNTAATFAKHAAPPSPSRRPSPRVAKVPKRSPARSSRCSTRTPIPRPPPPTRRRFRRRARSPSVATANLRRDDVD